MCLLSTCLCECTCIYPDNNNDNKWWLGLDTSEGSLCALCPGSALDHLGHHAVTCKYGENVVTWHNPNRDILLETRCWTHIGVKVEVGTRDHSKTCPADILLPNWFLGRNAALDVSITSPLNPSILLEAGVSATAAAWATESRKHQANDPKCSDLGWVCVPIWSLKRMELGEKKPLPLSPLCL